MQEDTSFRGDVMDSTLMPINKGKTGEDTNEAYLC